MPRNFARGEGRHTDETCRRPAQASVEAAIPDPVAPLEVARVFHDRGVVDRHQLARMPQRRRVRQTNENRIARGSGELELLPQMTLETAGSLDSQYFQSG